PESSSQASLFEAYGPQDGAHAGGRIVTVPGDPQRAADLFGQGRSRAVLAPQRAQVQHAPVRGAEECAGDRETAGVDPARLAHAHDAAGIVDVAGSARPPSERPQVDGAKLLGPVERAPATSHDCRAVVE